MIKMLLTPLILVIFCISAFSSPLHQKGSITTKEGQKIDGYIKFYHYKYTPKSIKFSENEFGEYKSFTSNDIAGFSCGNERFICADVEIEVSSDNTSTLDKNSEPILKSEKLFLEILLEGDKSLYLYISEKKRYFYYYKNPEGELKLYIQKFYTKEKGKKVFKLENLTYKQQLNENLGCDLKYKQAPKSDYNLDFFKGLYADCYSQSDQKPSYIAQKRKSNLEFGLIGGVNKAQYHNFSTTNHISLINEESLIVGGAYLQYKPKNKKHSFVSELVYLGDIREFTYVNTIYKENYFITEHFYQTYNDVINWNYYMQFPFQLFNKDVYLNSGLNSLINLSGKTTHDYYYQFYSDIESYRSVERSSINSFGILVGTGIDFGKLKVEARYQNNFISGNSFDRLSLYCFYQLYSTKNK